MRRRLMILLLMIVSPLPAWSNEWVIGEVSIVEDYTAYDPSSGILVTLTNKSYYAPSSPVATVCTQRFRVVVGIEGVTADLARNMYALLLAARTSGQRVRLFVDPDAQYTNTGGDGYCAVQIAGMGDVE